MHILPRNYDTTNSTFLWWQWLCRHGKLFVHPPDKRLSLWSCSCCLVFTSLQSKLYFPSKWPSIAAWTIFLPSSTLFPPAFSTQMNPWPTLLILVDFLVMGGMLQVYKRRHLTSWWQSVPSLPEVTCTRALQLCWHHWAWGHLLSPWTGFYNSRVSLPWRILDLPNCIIGIVAIGYVHNIMHNDSL